MQIDFLVVCDYAADFAGKLTLVGAFDVIRTKSLPLKVPQMGIGLRLRPDTGQAVPQKQRIGVNVRASNGAMVVRVDALVERKQPAADIPLDMESVSMAFNVAGAVFPQAGRYSVQVEAAGKVLGSAPLLVLLD